MKYVPCDWISSPTQALMSLFVLASKDGWVNIMYHGLDAVGIDQQVQTQAPGAYKDVYSVM